VIEIPVEKIVYKTIEKIVEVPVESVKIQTVEIIKEVPVEKITYVDREVEVEKIVYVDKIVEVERIIDRPVETIIEVEKLVSSKEDTRFCCSNIITFKTCLNVIVSINSIESSLAVIVTLATNFEIFKIGHGL
jgi:radical SAM superfamily enzyme